MNMLLRPVRSSLGQKYLMAVTGVCLTLFVLVHMAGNLLIFASGDALNDYADDLKSNPGILWSARVILLVLFLLHVVIGLRLKQQNSAARPIRYVREDTIQASWASRHMLLTGLLLLAFVLYHLAHFTFGALTRAEVYDRVTGERRTVNYLKLEEVYNPKTEQWVPRYEADPGKASQPLDEARTRMDVRTMVIAGFRNPWISLSYLVAMVFLWLHLWHGGSSLFQSLGIGHLQYKGVITALGPTISTLVLIGNCSIPLSIWMGLVK